MSRAVKISWPSVPADVVAIRIYRGNGAADSENGLIAELPYTALGYLDKSVEQNEAASYEYVASAVFSVNGALQEVPSNVADIELVRVAVNLPALEITLEVVEVADETGLTDGMSDPVPLDSIVFPTATDTPAAPVATDAPAVETPVVTDAPATETPVVDAPAAPTEAEATPATTEPAPVVAPVDTAAPEAPAPVADAPTVDTTTTDATPAAVTPSAVSATSTDSTVVDATAPTAPQVSQ
ncbi:MAG: hypothetical protein [Bacteriophage sp.]|nr:MAG: hypothetical protein [Bacteriophage sp.]